MNFTLSGSKAFEEHLLEKKLALPMTRHERLCLMYNDAKNYTMSNVQPLEEWYAPRAQLIQEYATMEWNAFGVALAPYLPNAPSVCAEIQSGFHQLREELNATQRFSLTVLCTMLGKVDHLRHVLLPSYQPVEPKAKSVWDKLFARETQAFLAPLCP